MTEGAREDLVRCALCGLRYSDREAERACRGCPIRRRCGLLRCPNCGYETVAPRKSRKRE